MRIPLAISSGRMPDPKYRGKYADQPYRSGSDYDYAANGRVHASLPLTTQQHADVKAAAKAAGTTVGRFLASIVVPNLPKPKKSKKKEN